MRGSIVAVSVSLLMLTGATVPAWSAAPPPAQQPAATQPAAAQPPASAAKPDAKAQSEIDREFAKASRGYRVREKDGQKVYCRMDRELDSHVTKMICLSREDLINRIESEKMTRDALR